MGSRVRSRVEGKLFPTTEIRYVTDPSGNFTPWNPNWIPGFSYLTMKEEISDVVDRSVRDHAVSHTKWVWSSTRRPTSGQDLSYPWYIEEYRPGSDWPTPFAEEAIASHEFPSFSPQLVGSMADAAFNEFSTQIPQEVDFINFGLDFREIGSLIPKLQNTMAQTVGGGYLTYKFGWAPLLGDLKKLGTLTTTVRKRLNWLRRTKGMKVRIGFRSKYTPEGSTTWNQTHLIGTLVSSSGTFQAQGTLYHELDRLGEIEGELRAFSAALGLLNPSAVVWERIPFSFVADWFFRTKSITDAFSYQPFPGRWELSNMTYSFKEKREWQFGLTGYGLYPFSLNPYIGTLVSERYVRGVGLPVSSTVLTRTEPTSGQLKLIAALLGAVSK